MTRRVLLFVAAGLLLVALGWVALRYVAPSAAPPPGAAAGAGIDAGGAIDATAARDAARGPEQVRVVDITGRVERQRPGQPWQPARIGEQLSASEAVRTSADGAARLSVGPRSRLEVTGGSEIAVREITEAAHRFRLRSGRLSVSYERDGKRRITIESPDGTATAEATAGRFSVLGTPRSMAVATERGEVQLAAAGKQVTVRGGQQAAVVDGQAPADPVAIPDEVLLSIAGLGGGPRRVTRPQATLAGQTQPGNRLIVDGREVVPGRDGRFSAKVPVPKRGARVTVTAQSPSGGRKQAEVRYVFVSGDPAQPQPKQGKIDGIDIRWGR